MVGMGHVGGSGEKLMKTGPRARHGIPNQT